MLYAALDDSTIMHPRTHPIYFSYAHALVIGGKDVVESFGWVGSKSEIYSHEKDIRSRLAFLIDSYSDMFCDDIVLVGCDHYFQRYQNLADIIDHNIVREGPFDNDVRKMFRTADQESRQEAKRMMSEFLRKRNMAYDMR